MIGPTMAKLPGLFKRDGIYQLCVVVPKRLQALYSGKTKLIQSLSTANRYEVGVLGSLHRAKMLGHFAQNGQLAHQFNLKHENEPITPQAAQHPTSSRLSPIG
jgi:hypothetical protein